MEIRFTRGIAWITAETLKSNLQKMVDNSRFTVGDIEIHGERKPWIKIREVRLREKKHYCGNHPFACPVRPWPQRHANAVYLEGADWVEWNDRVNDVLDEMGLGANVKTAVCVIRKDTKRRISYDGWFINQWNAVWDREADSDEYVDYCGRKAPASWYPEDTPGNYERKSYVASN